MTENTDGDRESRRARHHAIRAEVAQEEAEAAQAEVTEKAASLDVPLHLRIVRDPAFKEGALDTKFLEKHARA